MHIPFLSMGQGSNFRRRLKIFTVALTIYLDYKTIQKKDKWITVDKRDDLWERAHERNANRLLSAMIELEGLWVKLGQYLSTRADVLPDVYIQLLKQLQDSLPPRPLSEVYQTIEKELGKPKSEIFTDFDETPLATASIAQVHRSRLKDGRDVVVKVQHKGIKDVILQDLKNARTIVEWIAWAEPQYDFSPVIDEWCNEAPKELDFNTEAENTRKVAKNLNYRSRQRDSSTANYVDVLIPEVIQSAEKVLVLEYMDGVRLNDKAALEALGVDKQGLVESITRAYAHQIYIDGFFNGDPHPGNFLVSKEPPFQPVLLDFGLTKSISSTMKQALAKMFLASAEKDYAALLSAFTEMGLRLRLDVPEESMAAINLLFRQTTPAKESLENVRTLNKERESNMKSVKEKMQKYDKSAHRNPVDAFPGDAVIFMRVLNLLRGLSSLLDVHIVYFDIMRPFAESTLMAGNIRNELTENSGWIFDSPVHSQVETKLRHLLLELGQQQFITGIQVCAYKDGKVIIDTAAGTLGKYDPRPVQPDSLFSVFSATKGVTAGLVHWMVDKGKFSLVDIVANLWPDFAANGKEACKVAHVLNHTAGLHNAMLDVIKEDPYLMCNWEESLKRVATAKPESAPGSEQKYHSLSFGWLCGGLIEQASGKKFQEILEEAFIRPLDINGELYIGIPPGVESRLASLSLDMQDMQKVVSMNLPRISQEENASTKLEGATAFGDIAEAITVLPSLFNMLFIRRAIIPAANGHCSARALARYYAALATGGVIPPRPSSSEPPLGSHPHIPAFPSGEGKNKKKSKTGKCVRSSRKEEKKTAEPKKDNIMNGSCLHNESENVSASLFNGTDIHQAFLGLGAYEELVHPDGKFGLGFRRFNAERTAGSETRKMAFGHSGIGGSTALCDPNHNFAIAITVNKMSLGGATRKIIQLVYSELGLPLPDEFSTSGESGPDMQLNLREL